MRYCTTETARPGSRETDLGRRAVLLGSATLMLSACKAPTLSLIADSTEKVFAAGAAAGDGVVNRRLIDSIPYSTLAVRVGSQPWALMVLSRAERGELRWVSGDGVIFVTADGVLLRTQGMERDLSWTFWQQPSTKPWPQAGLQGASRRIGLRPPMEGPVPVDVSISAEGRVELSLFGETRKTTLYREQLNFPTWRWAAQNRYWVDQNGTVIQSVQHYCPSVPAITLAFVSHSHAA